MSENNALLDFMEKQTSVIEKLTERLEAKEADLHQKHDAPANVSTYTPLHGPGGIWSSPALERDVVSAHVRPVGIAPLLPLIPSVFTNPLFGILTGYTDVNGAEPTTSCEDAPSGYVKGGALTAQFGLLRRDSQTIDMDDVMLRMNRGEHTDLILRGQVLGLTNLEPQGLGQGDILNLVSASEMTTVGVALERQLSRQIWQGNPSTGTQFPGLDRMIATGQVDAETGTAMPAADSLVYDYSVSPDPADLGGLVEWLSSMEHNLRNNAYKMGLDPVTWVLALTSGLWFELSAVWPCAYNTNKCATAVVGDDSRVVVDGRDNVAERDLMRNNMYIDINGNRYPVVIDDGINEVDEGAGVFSSSAYFVPLTISGGMPVTYREYLDYRQAAADVAYAGGRLTAWWTDGGVYSWSLSQTKWCYTFHAKTQQRVVCRAPHLAGRIDGISYTPLHHLRSPYPDSPYFQDGGVSLRSNDPGYSAVWQ